MAQRRDRRIKRSPISSNITSSVTSAGVTTRYLLLGETQYNFSPPGIAGLLGVMTISGQIFMSPRASSQVCGQLGILSATADDGELEILRGNGVADGYCVRAPACADLRFQKLVERKSR